MSTARGPRVAVTRPAAQAGEWVVRLQAAGIDAFALPLIEIAPAADPAALIDTWANLASRTLVMFVSPNAVLHFFAARPHGTAWPAHVLAAAPGPGTGDALIASGLVPAQIVTPSADATQFDSEALWARIHDRDWHGAQVLLVRGDGGRDWLADRLVEAGAVVQVVHAYRRVVPRFEGTARAELEAASRPGGAIWLISSSQAVDHLEQVAGARRWAEAWAVATHPRIAARARRAGFGRVEEAGAGLASVVACIQLM